MASFQAGEGSNKRVTAPVGAIRATLAAAGAGTTEKWGWRYDAGFDTDADGVFDNPAAVTDPMQACIVMVPSTAVGNVAVSFSIGGMAAGFFGEAEPGVPLPLFGQITELWLENLDTVNAVDVSLMVTWMRTTDAGGQAGFPLITAANGFNWIG